MTMRRPIVRLKARKSAVPITLRATLATSRWPAWGGVLEDRRRDDHLAEVAAGELHVAHDRGDDLDRRDRQGGAEKERGKQALVGMRQQRVGQGPTERDAPP